MKTLKFISALFFVMITLALNSCKKEETPGPAGKDGSANISANVYSATNWAFSSPYYYTNFSVPELTSANINSAAVMVYFKTTSSWIAVPYTQYDSPYNYFMGFNTTVGNVQVTWFYDYSLSSGSNPNAYYGTTVQFKVVVIPPALIKLHPNVNLNNYNEVKETFRLKE